MDGEPDGAVEALIYFDPACSQRLCLTYAELQQQQDAVAAVAETFWFRPVTR